MTYRSDAVMRAKLTFPLRVLNICQFTDPFHYQDIAHADVAVDPSAFVKYI